MQTAHNSQINWTLGIKSVLAFEVNPSVGVVIISMSFSNKNVNCMKYCCMYLYSTLAVHSSPEPFH